MTSILSAKPALVALPPAHSAVSSEAVGVAANAVSATPFADALRVLGLQSESSSIGDGTVADTDTNIEKKSTKEEKKSSLGLADNATEIDNSPTLPGMATPMRPVAINISVADVQPQPSVIAAFVASGAVAPNAGSTETPSGVNHMQATDIALLTAAVSATQPQHVGVDMGGVLQAQRQAFAVANEMPRGMTLTLPSEESVRTVVPAEHNVSAESRLTLLATHLSVAGNADTGATGELTLGVAPDSSSPASNTMATINSATNADVTQTSMLKLPAGTPTQWRQPLIDALGDRIQVQLGSHSEHASIRLDPPMMGSIEILIRHEAGSLQVQLNASHSEVLRQLHSIGDSLRQDLAQRQFSNVTVLVSDSMRDGGEGRQKPRQAPEENKPSRALAEAEVGQTSSMFDLLFDKA